MKRFRSFLAADLDEFLAFKLAFGHKTYGPKGRSRKRLESFDRFITTRCLGRASDLRSAVKDWLSRPGTRKPRTVMADLAVVRQLCLFLLRRDPSGFLPDRDWGPTHPARFRPYILSLDEIRRLLAETERLPGGRFRVRTYRTLIMLLYCTGLRFGEALRLQLKEIDTVRRTLFVAESKGRSRWVPFNQELAGVIRGYLHARRAVVAPTPHGPLFVDADGRPLSTKRPSQTIRRLFRAIGIKPSLGRVGPRPYDLRHAFAVHRLTRWYRSGVDLHARLPWLSAYMGHASIVGTEVYLNATPELLQVASRRLATRLDASGGA